MLYAFACLRLMVANREEFDIVANSRSIYSVRDIRTPITLRNERAALVLLDRMIGDMLRLYPRTLEEDRALLAGDTLKPFSNEKHAIIQTAGEKEVLAHYRQHSLAGIQLLDVDVNDDDAYVKQVLSGCACVCACAWRGEGFGSHCSADTNLGGAVSARVLPCSTMSWSSAGRAAGSCSTAACTRGRTAMGCWGCAVAWSGAAGSRSRRPRTPTARTLRTSHGPTLCNEVSVSFGVVVLVLRREARVGVR